jgi:hypothetical protein
MIRRGFWLVLGATLGVAGYRRASRMARSLTQGAAPRASAPAGRLVLRAPEISSRSVIAGAARAGRAAAESAAFVRDVREGVAEYRERQDPAAGHTLEGQQGRSEQSGAAGRRPAP